MVCCVLPDGLRHNRTQLGKGVNPPHHHPGRRGAGLQ